MLGSILRRVKQNECGSATVEAAYAIPVLMTTIVGLAETANLYFTASSLENAVLHASRFGITGGADAGSSREAQVRAVIEKQTFGRIPVDDMTIETLVYAQFANVGEEEPYVDENDNEVYDGGEPYTDVNGNGQWDEDMGVAGLGGSGDIVLYRVTFSPESLTGLFTWATQAIELSATVAVRNEPF